MTAGRRRRARGAMRRLLAALLALSGAAAGAPRGEAATAPLPCRDYRGIPERRTDAPAGMVLIPAGAFRMGSDRFRPEERPVRTVRVGTFWIDRHDVTNAQFAAFVRATGYVTVAERPLDPARFPGAKPELLKPGAMVFTRPRQVADLDDVSQWWAYVPGANWKHPDGPASSISGRDGYPVVQVAYADALAYARWLGRDLPTEAEWEYAARGGIEDADYVWGNEKKPGGKPQANFWQGIFPVLDAGDDGFVGLAPVGCFPPNGYGLYDMAGNVWQWTRDDYAGGRGAQGAAKVLKGGSYLCADNYCMRYRPAARSPLDPDTGMSHVGFRTILRVKDGKPPVRRRWK